MTRSACAAVTQVVLLLVAGMASTTQAFSPSPPPLPPPMWCDDSCTTVDLSGNTVSLASNGVCQDGEGGSLGDACKAGTDCEDCGPRFMHPPSPPPVLASPSPTSCAWWCVWHSQGWANKCTWIGCNGCNVCSPNTCKPWCTQHQASWVSKCQWQSCDGCHTCDSNTCEPWCSNDPKPWTDKCGWQSCDGCSACPPPSSPPSHPQMLCSDTCDDDVNFLTGQAHPEYASNGICQDGGPSAQGYVRGSACAFGTDCTDCGPRTA